MSSANIKRITKNEIIFREKKFKINVLIDIEFRLI